MRVDVAAAGQGKGRGARNKDGEGRGGGGSTRRARVPGEGRSAACRRRQKAKSIILYKPVVTVACPIAALTPHVWRQWRRGQHEPSASQAKAEAETEAARLPRTSFRDRFFSRSPVCSGYRSRSQETRVRKVRSSSSASSWIKSLPMPSLALCCFDFLHLPLMHLRAPCCHLPLGKWHQVARRACHLASASGTQSLGHHTCRSSCLPPGTAVPAAL